MSNSTFEDSLSRLEEIVQELEKGQMPLEKSLELFGEGIERSRQCQKILEKAEQRIVILTQNNDGETLFQETRQYSDAGGRE